MEYRLEASYTRLVEMNDAHTAQAMELQVQNSFSKYDGGIMDPMTGIPRPNHGGSASVLATWTCAYCNPDSTFYRGKELLQRIIRLAQFMVNRQHSDGTITLGSTNYHSPPDTGFVVAGLAQVCQLLEGAREPELQPVIDSLDTFLRQAVPAMLTGGCHTPNHRWVLTAALGLLYERYGDQRLADRAEEWLAEGMDITEDGEWTERSNGIYNAVSDLMLYHAARTLGRPELLEPIRDNLRMMVYLVHPDGEVVTDYSGRQDYGERNDLSSYMSISRLMAWNGQDGLLVSLADAAAEAVTHPGTVNNHVMLNILLHPRVSLGNIRREPLPDSYEMVINETYPIDRYLSDYAALGPRPPIRNSSAHTAFGSPVVRFRNGRTSATVMTRSPSILSLRHGKARLLGVKLTTAFLPGLVPFEGLECTEGSYVLKSVMTKGYTGPIPGLPRRSSGKDLMDTLPWYLLPHEKRPVTHLQEHRMEAKISHEGNRWEIRVETDEAEDLFTQLTLLFDSSGWLEGEGLKPAAEEGHYFLTTGEAVYRAGGASIRISTGAHEHWVGVLRNDTLPGGCLALSINWMTPVDRTLVITLDDQDEATI